MSPQQTLTSPVRIRTISFDRPAVRGTSALAEPAAEPRMFETLVINPAPPFSRVTPLRLVDGQGSAQSGVAGVAGAKTLTQGQTRLTRRGRLALLFVAVLCMLFGFSIGNGVSFSAGVAPVPTSTHSVVVLPGQTLWAIATQAAPKADPRATVQQIIVLNHLASTALQPGQTLALPS
jgi:LysM repeat protein